MLSKKEQSILNTYQDPILPPLCKIIFIVMCVLVPAMLLVDINAFIRYDHSLGIIHFFHNFVITGFGSWLFFSVILSALSFAAIRQSKKRYLHQKEESGIIDITEEDSERTDKAIKKLTKVYLKYIRVSAAGTVIWGIFFLIINFI